MEEMERKNLSRNESEQPEIKDSGERYVNANGGQRDVDEGKFDPAYIPLYIIKRYMKKPEYLDLFIRCRAIRLQKYDDIGEFSAKLKAILDFALNFSGDYCNNLEKIATFLELASKKYSFENWVKLTTDTDFYRLRRSLCRHAYKCLMDYTDEPHHEAMVFNATVLLSNFTENEVMSYRNEPEKYALKGLTDLGCEKENSV